MIFLKQSTSVTVQFGVFVDATDGVTLEVGLATAMDNATTGIRLTKNGGTLADRNDATAPAYDAMGLYKIVLDATDTNTLGTLKMVFEEAATCLPQWMDFMVVTANIWDSWCSTDYQTVDVIQIASDTGAATNLSEAAQCLIPVTCNGTPSTTVITTSLTTTADMHNGRIISFTDDTTTAGLRGQSTDILDTDASGGLTVTALSVAPVSGDTGVIS